MKIFFLQNKCTYTTHQYWGKVSKIFHILCLYLQLPAIMNLILCTLRLENFMTSCRDKLYHHTVSNRIKFNFLIIFFGKTSSSKSLPFSGIESEIENSACNRTLLNRQNQKFHWLWQQYCDWSDQQQWCSHESCEW